jgi:RNA polymerase sigma-70 factor (ECF subfamily)
MLNDQSLVSAVLSGNRAALQEFIKRHERLVSYMVARLVDDKSDREELCQDIFLKAYEKLSEFNFQSRLSTWIATIAYRHGVNHLRKRKVKWLELPEDADNWNFIEPENTEQKIEDEDLERIILENVRELPPQYKIVLTLYHIENMNYTEIGETTGMPEGTVKNYLFRARNLLKERVKKYLGTEELI